MQWIYKMANDAWLSSVMLYNSSTSTLDYSNKQQWIMIFLLTQIDLQLEWEWTVTKQHIDTLACYFE